MGDSSPKVQVREGIADYPHPDILSVCTNMSKIVTRKEAASIAARQDTSSIDVPRSSKPVQGASNLLFIVCVCILYLLIYGRLPIKAYNFPQFSSNIVSVARLQNLFELENELFHLQNWLWQRQSSMPNDYAIG